MASEIMARINGVWVDPHNAGIYSLDSNSSSGPSILVKAHRLTGKAPHYRDDLV